MLLASQPSYIREVLGTAKSFLVPDQRLPTNIVDSPAFENQRSAPLERFVAFMRSVAQRVREKVGAA